MEVICYVCNKRTKEWTENLAETKSKHSGTPITVFITGFLKDYISLRDINDVTNCICSDCLSRIYSYDWMCLKVKEQEREFHMLLMSTEKNFISSRIKTEDLVESKAKIANGRKFKDESSKDVKPTISGTELLQTGTPVENAKRSKPIIIRVVKRVPFLKSKPTVPASTTPSPAKPTTAVIKRIAPDGVPPSGSKLLLTPKTKSKIGIKVCEYCGEKFTNSGTAFENHVKIHTKSTGVITCHVCLYQMCDSDKDEFKNHVKKHIKGTAKQCVICDEGGSENFDLRYHVQKHHTAANQLCDLCGKTFVFASALSKHRKSHNEDRPEECPHCDKTFKFKRSLKEHMLTHTQTEPEFGCAFCDKKFKRRDHCRTHERRHREDTKKFKCTICPAAFESKHDLNLHLQRKHDAEKPHDRNRR
ncbi:zinc finger protein Xfin-like [Sitodiplosis mosellana]|uniref:zinc finger protein Xfin-like n=1 Tax=Sitodiplosis mosellana TaxID=263140 RepID=UPI002444B87A|nr:zinc finger protein Xfin-like [Sitodiplosis mosellana]